MEILLLIGIVILLDIILVVMVVRKRRHVSKNIEQQTQKHWHKILGIPDAAGQVIEVTKLLDWVLGQQGYTGSLAQKLKQVEKRTGKPVEPVWYIHKLRNRVAHELGVEITPRDQKKVLTNSKAFLRRLGLKMADHVRH